MRKLLKITFALALAPVLVAGTAFGQDVADIEQAGGSTAITSQEDAGVGTIRGLFGGSMSNDDAFTQKNGSSLFARQINSPGSHTLLGEQVGNGQHNASVFQAGGNSGHFAEVQQADDAGFGSSGANNDARLHQVGSSDNHARMTQLGSSNKVGGSALSSSATTVTFKISAKRAQQRAGSSGGNELRITQRGSDNKLFALQRGSSNFMKFDQRNGSRAEVQQDGYNNAVSGNSGGTGKFVNRAGSELYVNQNGTSNVVYGGQGGAANTAWVDQQGAGNECQISQ